MNLFQRLSSTARVCVTELRPCQCDTHHGWRSSKMWEMLVTRTTG